MAVMDCSVPQNSFRIFEKDPILLFIFGFVTLNHTTGCLCCTQVSTLYVRWVSSLDELILATNQPMHIAQAVSKSKMAMSIYGDEKNELCGEDGAETKTDEGCLQR